jgi:hypothetical protein
MPKERPVFDFDNAGVRTMAKRMIDQARGKHWWDFTKCRDQRSLDANAYYWSVVLPCFAAGLTEAWGESYDSDMAHEWCRKEWLTRSVVNRKTGEVALIPRSTTDLDTKEFGEYLDKIIKHAAEYLNTEIPIALRAAERRSA